MATDEPPYLTIGTDVSAKYKGAFCEAKVKKVNRVVKCKVTFKNNLGTFMVTDDQIKGPLRIGADIDAKHPEKSQFCEAVINKLQDYSQYTVVFDDGDETTLRRTSLCLKSGRHFAESPTLDQFPLTNPEHFGTPVIGSSKFKRKRRSTMNSSIDYESSEDESVPRRIKAIRGKEQNPDLGKVVCVDYGDRRKKENWYPGLIYPHLSQSAIKLAKEEHLVRSFKDGKYYQVPKKDIREFSKETIQKIENNSLKTAIEKAINYLEKDELPPNWDKALFASLDALSGEEDSQETDSDTSDDEPSEEKDRFVAQLYKFMDERGTPINKAPTVSNRDLNLYKLFKIMHKLGGYNKVTNKNKWKAVYVKMGLPQSNMNGPNQIKIAYKRFLQSFEDFYRKLGCTMVSNSRSTRGRHRSDRNIIITRTRDREAASPKSRTAKEKAATDKKSEPDKPSKPEPKATKTPSDDVPASSKTSEDSKAKTPDKKRTSDKQGPPRSEDAKEDGRRRMATPKTPEDSKPRLVRQTSLTRQGDKRGDSATRAPLEKARTREDARKEKVDSPEKKGTRSSLKMEQAAAKETKAKKEEKITPSKPTKKEETPKSSSRERKPPPRKQEDPKPTPPAAKEKREVPQRDKKEDPKPAAEPPKEEKPKVKKEEAEEKSPKRKLERLKEKAPPRNQSEEKPKEEEKVVREERPRLDSVSKREEKMRQRIKKEELPVSGDEGGPDVSGDGDGSSHDSFERKPPGSRFKGEEEEPPSKAKRRSLKQDDKDEKESLLGMSDSDESCTNDSDKNYKEVKHNEIEIGDRVKVKYGRGRLQKVYEAKVLKIEMEAGEKKFYVHYAGWNTRYDEWVKKNNIVANITSNKNQQKAEGTLKPSASTSSLKKIDRGRPPGLLANTKPDRKNSTSSGSSSRATRSEKKGLLSGGLESKLRRTRRKSGTATSATDASQESDTDAMDNEDDLSSSFKEELFSDDEEKEKFEDAKAINELERAMGAEEDKLAVKAEDKDKKIGDGKEVGGAKVKKEEVVESKAALSFEGLIKKSMDGTASLKKSASVKDEKVSIGEKTIVKNETASDSPSVSIFGSVLSSFQNSIITPDEKKTALKPVDSPLGCITKSATEVSGTKKLDLKNMPVAQGMPLNVKIPPSLSASLKLNPSLGVQSTPGSFKLGDLGTPRTKDNKVPFRPLVDEISFKVTNSHKADDIKNVKPLETKSIFSTKSSARFGDSKTPIKLEDARAAKLDDTKNPSRLSEVKGAMKLDDTKISFKSADTKIPIKLEDLKNLASSSDSKVSLTLNEKGSIKLTDSKTLIKLEDKDISKIEFNKTGYNKIPVKLSGNKIRQLKPAANASQVKGVAKTLEDEDNSQLKVTSVKTAADPSSLTSKNSTISKTNTASVSNKSSYSGPSSLMGDLNLSLKTVSDIKSSAKSTETSKLTCSESTPKKLDVKKEDTDTKPKDSFDLLLESSNPGYCPNPPKIPDAKDVFSFSFGSASTTKESASFPKYSTGPSDSFCRITPKPSETVDVSKMIPGILERLKKDVVSDSKASDSPPPPKEELSFDFLRGSQTSSKSLSRSDSSSSLRICESDTNDSNAELKDTPSIAKPEAPESVKLPEVKKDGKSASKPASESNAGSNSSSSGAVLKPTTTSVISHPASVITTTSMSVSKESHAISDNKVALLSEEKSKVPLSSIQNPASTETTSKLKDSQNSDVIKTPVAPASLDSFSIFGTKVDKESPKTDADSSLAKCESKESLFDQIKASLDEAKSAPKSEQSSVIKFVSESTTTVPPESKSTTSAVVKEEKDTVRDQDKVQSKAAADDPENSPQETSAGALKDSSTNSPAEPEKELGADTSAATEGSPFSQLTKKDLKKKKLGKKSGKKFSELSEKDKDVKMKDVKLKAKKRLRPEHGDSDKSKDPDLKTKSKKIKKNKKRFSRHEDSFVEHLKKLDSREEDQRLSDKIKKRDRKRNEKKFLKAGTSKSDFFDSKAELKKKKSKKNRDKIAADKDFFEKKIKKKRKLHPEPEDTDSEKESLTKKHKKQRKKFKSVKDCSSSDEDPEDTYFKDKNKESPYLRQDSSKSDDPDMSFLLCEEKVPASPGGGNDDLDTSGTSSNDDLAMDLLPRVYPSCSRDSPGAKHSVLDNTPPTTPSSTESLLSSSPSHNTDRDLHYPESTQSCEGEQLFQGRVRASEEYRAAATLAFAVGKSVEEDYESKREGVSKRKKKRVQRYSEPAKSPKSNFSRVSKVDNYCEDSSGTSPATSSSPTYGNLSSTLSFSRSLPHRLSEGASKYFYVPLHEKDPEKRISVLQDKMAALRKKYMALRAEVVAIDHKRRKARKKVREAGGTGVANPSAHSEDGHSGS